MHRCSLARFVARLRANSLATTQIGPSMASGRTALSAFFPMASIGFRPQPPSEPLGPPAPTARCTARCTAQRTAR